MIALDPIGAARRAVSANPERPATAVILDAPDVRLVVFRLAPGQQVAPHRSPSTVTITVLEGTGIITGPESLRRCAPGDVVAYDPDELHGMRATEEEFLLLAAITPRPGARPAEHAPVAPVRRGED